MGEARLEPGCSASSIQRRSLRDFVCEASCVSLLPHEGDAFPAEAIKRRHIRQIRKKLAGKGPLATAVLASRLAPVRWCG